MRTKGKWYPIVENEEHEESNIYCNDWVIASVAGGCPDGESIANAEYICKAVNSHEMMLKILTHIDNGFSSVEVGKHLKIRKGSSMYMELKNLLKDIRGE